MQDIGSLIRPGWESRERTCRMHLSSLSYHNTVLLRNNRRNGVIEAEILVLLHEP